MKVELKKLLKVLELASMGWSVDPVSVEFTKDAVIALNTDEALTMMSYLKMDTHVIENYNPIGQLVIGEDVVKSLKKMFKGDEKVELDLQGDNIVIKGSRETFRFPNQTLTREKIKPEMKLLEYGYILSKPTIKAVYRVDYTMLRDLPYEEVVKLRFKPEGILVVTDVSGGVYEAWVKVLEINQKPEGEIMLSFDGDVLSTISDLIETGVGWLIVTESPLHIVAEDKMLDAKVTYVVLPRAVE